jgi:hypothetical protein
VSDGFVPPDLTREEAQVLYHASFYMTANAQPQPLGHPALASHTAQMKLADSLGEDLPEQALQDVQRRMDEISERARQRARTQQAIRSQHQNG